MRAVARCERKEEERCRSEVAWERTSLCGEGSRGGMVVDRDRTAQELRFGRSRQKYLSQIFVWLDGYCMLDSM
jgi:hypothetical protein